MASSGDRYDSIVIGGGSAGLAFARTAAEKGYSLLLAEQAELGGTCVNRGCVPKKLLWKAGHHRVEAMRNPALTAGRLDYAELRRRIQTKIETIRASYSDDLSDLGIARVSGVAELIEGGIRINGDTYLSDRIVLATGARPSALKDVEGAELAVTSDDVIAWSELPEHVVFLGGGYIGCELASILLAFGVKIAIVDPSDGILGQFRDDLSQRASDILTERGASLHLGVEPQRIERATTGLTLTLSDGTTLSTDAVVAAVGRTPNLETLGPLATTLEVGDSGALAINDRFETSRKGVYAIGDVADRLPLTPVATRDGETLARQLTGDDTAVPIDLSLVATAAFVMPPLAQIGTRGDDHDTGGEGHDLADVALSPEHHWSTRHYQSVDRTPDGKLAAVGLMAESAPDMIAPFAALLAVDAGQNADDATGVHPSFGEETVGR